MNNKKETNVTLYNWFQKRYNNAVIFQTRLNFIFCYVLVEYVLLNICYDMPDNYNPLPVINKNAIRRFHLTSERKTLVFCVDVDIMICTSKVYRRPERPKSSRYNPYVRWWPIWWRMDADIYFFFHHQWPKVGS